MNLETKPGNSRHFFTAPWDPIVDRRGDALGLRALTDVFAESVAPELSNRIQDGRWVTILAWCLSRSHELFHASGGAAVASREAQRRRYAWLQPLELLWVARTLQLIDDERVRSLAGQRAVLAWLDSKRLDNTFGMTATSVATIERVYGHHIQDDLQHALMLVHRQRTHKASISEKPASRRSA